MTDIAIRASNLSKCYHIYDNPRDRLKQFVVPALQRMAGQTPRQHFREFWALKDVSFEIKKRKAMRDYPELSLSTQEISGGFMLTFAQIKVEQSESSDSTGQVTLEISRMLGILKGEMSRQQLQDALDLNSRNNFDKRYLKPAIELKLIEHTIPDKPNSRLQKYRLTQAGQAQLRIRNRKAP